MELTEPVCLSFGLRYLNNFAKASVLSSHVRLGLTKDLPVVVEWQVRLTARVHVREAGGML